MEYRSHDRCEHFTHFGDDGTVAALSQCRGHNNTDKFLRGFVSTPDFAFDIYQNPESLPSTSDDRDETKGIYIRLPNMNYLLVLAKCCTRAINHHRFQIVA